MLNTSIRLHWLHLKEFGRALVIRTLRPGFVWLANYRIVLLESELYRLDSRGPFPEGQFRRVRSAVGASEMHLRELTDRMSELERCQLARQTPKWGLDLMDIAHYARISRAQIHAALGSSSRRPTPYELMHAQNDSNAPVPFCQVVRARHDSRRTS